MCELCCLVVLVSTHSKVNQLHVYIYPLFYGFLSHLGHRRALSRVPCATLYVLISFLIYTQYHQCIHVNPSLPIHPALLLSLLSPCVRSLEPLEKACAQQQRLRAAKQ